MSASTGLLPELHQLHLKLQELRDELNRGPRLVKAREQAVTQEREAHQKLKDQLVQLRKLADQKNLQLKTNESKILDLQGKLNTVSTNKEYEILSMQIEADRMANSVLENEILEALENVDDCQRQIAARAAKCVELEKQVEETRRQVDSVRQGLAESAAEIERQLIEKETGLPDVIRDAYRRLVSAHGAAALTSVEKDACTECYSIVSPQERVQLNTHKIVFCRSCGRIMYKAVAE